MPNGTCSDDGCTETVFRRGLCQKAFHRQWKRADALKLSPAALTDAEFAAVQKTRRTGSYPARSSYYEMVYRCTNPAHPRYADYGGRGITVCPTWLEPRGRGLANYESDLGPKPDAGQRWTVDRIDNDGPYCGGRCGGTCGYGTAGNVRWATYAEQAANRNRKTLTCVVCGEQFTAMLSHAQYCSTACYQRAYAARKKLVASPDAGGESATIRA